MKVKTVSIILGLCLGCLPVFSQGTLEIDQQATGVEAGAATIQNYEPCGQSFTPSLSGVGFIQLQVADANPGNDLGATLVLNLRSGSITGSILGSTTPLVLPDGNGIPAVSTFYFPTAITVNPGTMYYFDIVPQAGSDSWNVFGRDPVNPNYPGGTAFLNGSPTENDLWFTEGIVTAPEPSVTWLAFLGSGLFLAWRRWRFKFP